MSFASRQRREDTSHTQTIIFTEGVHAGHPGEVCTSKYACGAYQIDLYCTACGDRFGTRVYGNIMSGCKENHRRPQFGHSVDWESVEQLQWEELKRSPHGGIIV